MENEITILSQEYNLLLRLIEEINSNNFLNTQAFSITINTTENSFVATGSNYKDGWKVIFEFVNSTAPTGFVQGQVYEIMSIDNNKFKIKDLDGNPINIASVPTSYNYIVRLYFTPEQLNYLADDKHADISAIRNKLNRMYQKVKSINASLVSMEKSSPIDIHFNELNIVKNTALSARIYSPESLLAINNLSSGVIYASYEIFAESIDTARYGRLYKWVDSWYKIGTTPYGHDVVGDGRNLGTNPDYWAITTEMANVDGDDRLSSAEIASIYQNSAYSTIGNHPFIIYRGVLQVGQTYYFSLKVKDDDGQEFTTCSSGVTIAAPSAVGAAFTAVVQSDGVKITVVNTSGTSKGYYIERSEGWDNYPEHPFDRVATLSINSVGTREFIDTPEWNDRYEYRICPFTYSNGQIVLGTYSDFTVVNYFISTVVNPVVKSIDATVLSSTQIIIDWKRADKVSAATNLYRMQKQFNGSFASTQLFLKKASSTDVNPPAMTIDYFSDDGLTPNTVYKYKIQYVGSSGYMETPEITTHASGSILDGIKKKSPSITDIQSLLFLSEDKIQQMKSKIDPDNAAYDSKFDKNVGYFIKQWWPDIKNRDNGAQTVKYNYARDWNVDNWGIADYYTIQLVLAYHLTNDMSYIDRVWKELSYDAVPGDTFNEGSLSVKHGYLIRNPERRNNYDEYSGAYHVALVYDWAYSLLTSDQRVQLGQWILDKCCTYDYNSYHESGGTDVSNTTDYTVTPHTIHDMLLDWKDEIGNNIVRNRTALVVAIATASIGENLTCHVMNEQTQPAVQDGRTPTQVAERVIGMVLCSVKKCLSMFDESGAFHAGFTYYHGNYLAFIEFQWICKEIFGFDVFDFYNHEDPKHGYTMPEERKIGSGRKNALFVSTYMGLPTWLRGKYTGVFNYGDCTDEDATPVGNGYLAEKFNKDDDTDTYNAGIWKIEQMDYTAQVWKGYTIPMYLIDHTSVPDKYSPENMNLATKNLFKGKNTEIAVMINDWSDYYPAKAFMRGGGFVYDHTHFDRGNYMFFAKNVKWTVDLGYPIVFPGWGSGWWRYNSGRVKTQSHNTVFLDNINQNLNYCPTTLDPDPSINKWSIDLKPTYYGHVQSMIRELELDSKNLKITDTILLNAPMQITSQFLFYSKYDKCHIKISDDGKILKLKSLRVDDGEYECYYVRINSPSNATWDVSYYRLPVPERFRTFEKDTNGIELPGSGTPMLCKIVVPTSAELNVVVEYEFLERL